MSYYRHILVGLDLSPESALVVDHVQELFKDRDVRISLVHVQEPLSFAYGGDVPMDLSDVQTQMEERARTRLDEFCHQLGLTYVSCSPFRVPIARLAAAHAALKSKGKAGEKLKS